MFSIMVFLWGYAFFRNRKKSIGPMKNQLMLIVIASIIYGIAMEFVQKYFVANRSFEVGDIVADTAGTLVGAWFVRTRYIKK